MKLSWILIAFAGTAALLSASMRAPVITQPLINTAAPFPRVSVSGSEDVGCRAVEVRASGTGTVLFSSDTDGALKDSGSDVITIPWPADPVRTDRLVSRATSVTWSHPMFGQPSAALLRIAERMPDGSRGPLRIATFPEVDHGSLPVISIVVPEGAFFDADSGIYVVGNAAWHPTAQMRAMQSEDKRWWKYPGNFHFRGKAWERNGMIQMLGPDGKEVFGCDAGFRVNGQMTRGFPQHALRVSLKAPLPIELFPGQGLGTQAVVLKAGGNDQMKAVLRDALAQELCADMPFDVSRSISCVLYVNGAYWGVHQLRQRIDEKELARRYELRAKDVEIVEITNDRPLGESSAVAAFEHDRKVLLSLDPTSPDFVEKVGTLIDINGFLHYMAATLILDNKDWPDNNVKMWRVSPGKGRGEALARWHFVMADMDLGLGAYGAVDAPLFARIARKGSPIPDMFHAVLRSRAMAQAFYRVLDDLLSGPLGRTVTSARLDAIVREMTPEMERHIARWRRPVTTMAWSKEVDRVRNYLNERPEAVRASAPPLLH